jgi:pyrroline-5-carboxylate reductase
MNSPPFSPSQNNQQTPAFIGGGNMARALIGGLIKRGLAPESIAVAEPHAATRLALAQDFGVIVHSESHAAVEGKSVWLLAVKPQMLGSVCEALRAQVEQAAPLVISIAAGISLRSLQMWLGPKAKLVRTMPNTPALIGAGITALYAETDISEADRVIAERLLQAAGATVWVEHEEQLDAVTATSGSGPAYFFLLIEAMQAAAMAQGLSAQTARALVLNTAYGAAKMALASDEDASILRERVTSPGGTTAAALAVFESANFRGHVADAIAAATLRGKSLSAQFG